MTQQAVLYIRSSKDRAEMGLPAQKAELQAFAAREGLRVVQTFSDMEISGSLDEASRPGLHALLEALRAPGRAWGAILALDPSRLARDPMLALYVTREAERHGVAVRYAKLPMDGTSAFGETMLNVVRAFDRLHARLSAEKGRGGMVANVGSGFRAGGAAPFGYSLVRRATGGTRGGVAVVKSTLALDASVGARVGAFLKARAAGVSRSEAAKRARLVKPAASLIAIERNALTYAGYTVWNMRRKVKPTRDDPRKTMAWRPRAEWVLSAKPTHAALITRDEAERVLALHAGVQAPQPRVRAPEKFLLSGLLFTPDGAQWHGDAHDHAYRAGTRGRRVSAPFIESEVLRHVAADFADRAFLRRTVAEARRMAGEIEADPAALEDAIRKAEKRLANLVGMGAESGDRALLEGIRQAEATLAGLRENQAAWATRKALKEQLLAVSEADIRDFLASTADELRRGEIGLLEMLGYSGDDRMRPDQLRQVLSTLVLRVELDPATRQFSIHYRVPVTGVRMASPRGFEDNSGAGLTLAVVSCGRLPVRTPRRAALAA